MIRTASNRLCQIMARTLGAETCKPSRTCSEHEDWPAHLLELKSGCGQVAATSMSKPVSKSYNKLTAL